jgi:hypothetical protein
MPLGTGSSIASRIIALCRHRWARQTERAPYHFSLNCPPLPPLAPLAAGVTLGCHVRACGHEPQRGGPAAGATLGCHVRACRAGAPGARDGRLWSET